MREDLSADGQTEYIQEHLDDDITVEYDDGMSTFSRAGGNISWTLKAKCQKRTSLFYVKKRAENKCVRRSRQICKSGNRTAG